MALPIDMSKVSAEDKYPEGRFRARIISAGIYPKKDSGKELDETGAIVGEVNDEGNQKYGGINVGLRYIEHSSNYTVDEAGKDLSMVGRTRFEFFTFHPKMIQNIKRLFIAAGLGDSSDEQELIGQEIDFQSVDKVDKNDPDGPKKSRLQKTMVAMG